MEPVSMNEIEMALRDSGLSDLAKVGEVAAAVRASKGIIYDAIRRGDLEVIRLGGARSHMRINVAAVARWLHRHRS